MVTNATIHKLPKIDFLTVYLSRAVPHCQAVGSVSIYVSPAKNMFFVLFCFAFLLYFASLCDIGSCCKELMSSMAVVVYAGKHQRRDPEQCLTSNQQKKTFLPIFVLRVYSGSAPQKQGQQLVTSGAGGSTGAPILHQLWGKRENIGANLCSEKLLQKS